mmetsp:Transcript_6767/g.15643  ORF Transcript_6767/g.15643 Transcript_6767/m.15643 type:complete len:727 (+) Transcript_6767:1370-3550(+)
MVGRLGAWARRRLGRGRARHGLGRGLSSWLGGCGRGARLVRGLRARARCRFISGLGRGISGRRTGGKTGRRTGRRPSWLLSGRSRGLSRGGIRGLSRRLAGGECRRGPSRGTARREPRRRTRRELGRRGSRPVRESVLDPSVPDPGRPRARRELPAAAPSLVEDQLPALPEDVALVPAGGGVPHPPGRVDVERVSGPGLRQDGTGKLPEGCLLAVPPSVQGLVLVDQIPPVGVRDVVPVLAGTVVDPHGARARRRGVYGERRHEEIPRRLDREVVPRRAVPARERRLELRARPAAVVGAVGWAGQGCLVAVADRVAAAALGGRARLADAVGVARLVAVAGVAVVAVRVGLALGLLAGHDRGVEVRDPRQDVVDLPRVVRLVGPGGVLHAPLGPRSGVREELPAGTVITGYRVALVGLARVREDGAEPAPGVAVSVVRVGVGARVLGPAVVEAAEVVRRLVSEGVVAGGAVEPREAEHGTLVRPHVRYPARAGYPHEERDHVGPVLRPQRVDLVRLPVAVDPELGDGVPVRLVGLVVLDPDRVDESHARVDAAEGEGLVGLLDGQVDTGQYRGLCVTGRRAAGVEEGVLTLGRRRVRHEHVERVRRRRLEVATAGVTAPRRGRPADEPPPVPPHEDVVRGPVSEGVRVVTPRVSHDRVAPHRVRLVPPRAGRRCRVPLAGQVAPAFLPAERPASAVFFAPRGGLLPVEFIHVHRHDVPLVHPLDVRQ